MQQIYRSFNSKSIFHSSNLLKERLREIIPIKQALLRDIRKQYGQKEICKVTVDQAIGGMRNVFGLFYDISLLDSKTGITFRDYNIPEIQEYLQKAKNGNEPLPEALFWLLLTGDFPSDQEFKFVQEEWKRRGELDQETVKFITSLPKQLHPMTMLSQSVLYLQKDSTFQQAYESGKATKPQYWEYYYEDAMDLVAKLPRVAALIYRHKYKNGNLISSDNSLDWAANYSHMMGFDQFNAYELFRMYLSIHADHEGGNVSAHATHLVGSALADQYLSYSAGINGLAGPLHGLANQEVLKWLIEIREKLGDKVSNEKIQEYVLNTIREGRVVPGYGHAVLRYTDPRYIHQKNFAERLIKDDPLVELVKQCYHVIPPVLKTIGKIQNPWPNVDAHSGVLLNHYGLKEFEYYTVVFAVSRALGCTANLVWARAFGLPIERPGSITMRWIEEKFGENQSVK
ncbi:unnamed protein product (macronuclear) [Paramecium tetraurelia]|uniref:Citrate synthase n=1 Tax=Paramecium tetraurelia TaxID=5888 RepID=A0E606_PARTE|nr:uncharacterized protein GSPATT00003586001 [Paramecium tetraurelia]CAK90723.1 unnamed protein product [Paramecium tetraurelia]|eukprot:XP_001458120.1 hypothetical protein (macronuclear) [Paramecium tetraurelia strain d4-2]